MNTYTSSIDLKTSLDYYRNSARQSKALLTEVFEYSHSVMLIVNPESGDIIDANIAACQYYGYSKEQMQSMKIYSINIWTPQQIKSEMESAKKEERRYFLFKHRLSSGEIRDVEVYSGPMSVKDKKYLFSIVHDVSERLKVEREKEELIVKLEKALKEIKTLQGILPICSSCKKIRDDKGYWTQLEEYLSDHSDAELSHGICPDCMKKLYPDFV
ncbi:MAG: PAS domain S-box protein [Desulfobacteraceae bacterium]|nr:PAS domain S-box protein [Desulfobacteraceae bacterium]MCB9494970.1 PAS domain S-box protein [Desulfobacteraceae bacterium]